MKYPFDFKELTDDLRWTAPLLGHYDWEDPTVDGVSPEESGIIFIYEGGLLYTNQSGGTHCLHPKACGRMLVPSVIPVDSLARIENLLYDEGRNLSESHINGIDAILAENPLLKDFKVDRSRLADSMEAWIYATYKEIHPCVIVTENSD